MDVLSPFDLSVIASVDTQSESEALAAIATAKQLYLDRDNWIPASERLAVLERLAQLMTNEADELAVQIAKEGGKPLVDAKIEVGRAIEGVRLAAHSLPDVMRGQSVPMNLSPASMNRQANIEHEPIGPVLALSAFNHPLNLIVHQVIPAVAVGCPVVVKPASATPLSCLRLCELLVEAGLPKEWCQPVVCSASVAESMATSSDITFLSFIGSAAIGWMLRSKLAPGVRCALEHGGVAPVIVDESADIEKMLPGLTKGGFYHAGQVCVSVQRVFAPASIASSLASKLAEAASKLTVGDPTSEQTDVGPLIKPGEVDRVHQWVQDAVSAGATLVCGGEKLSDTTYSPTVLLDPREDVEVSTKEVFGPVVCVYSYSDRQEAIKAANSLPFAFQAAVYGENLGAVMDTAKRLDASAVMVNDHTAFRVDWMPFAGRRASGYGIGGIGYTMEDMVQHKMTVLNLS